MLRVLCVTLDPHLMSGVTQAFPELKFEVTQLSALARTTPNSWDVLVLDLDILKDSQLSLEFLNAITRSARHTIALVSSRREPIKPLLLQTNAVVLHSPTTTGELVIVLNRLLRPRSGPENSCRSTSGATL